MQTVPLHPDGGGGQRENLIEIPSGVFRTPITAPSGTGLAGMETSFIRKYFRNSAALHDCCRSEPARDGPHPSLIGIAGSTQREHGKSSLWSLPGVRGHALRILEAKIGPPHIGEAQAIRLRKPGPAQIGGPLHVASKEDMPCVHSIFPRFIAQPSALIGCFRCSTRQRASRAAVVRRIHRTTSNGRARTRIASRSRLRDFPSPSFPLRRRKTH